MIIFLESQQFNNTHNSNLRDELKATFENNMIKEIGNEFLGFNDLMNIFNAIKTTTMSDVCDDIL